MSNGTETVTINTPPAPGATQQPSLTPEQVAAASAALKTGGAVRTTAAISTSPQQQQTPPADPDRPAWLPSKFKTAEDLAKAYGELEKKQGGGQQQQTPQTTQQPQTAEQTPNDAQQQQQSQTPPSTDQQVVDMLTKAGVKYDDLNAQFQKDGKLSDESYTKLAAGGFSRELVDSWIAGQNAVVQSLRAQIFAGVEGGEAKYNEMTAWAAKNFQPAEIAEFNRQVNGGVASAKLAVSGLAARFSAAGMNEPNLVSGATAAGADNEVYASRAEQVRDLRDPRYQTDSAFRARVEAKSLRSPF